MTAGSRPRSDTAAGWSPQACALVTEASADILRRVDIVGPGGHGKTVLLDALAAAFHGAGVVVRRDLPPAGEALAPDVALLVDDAHLLGAADVERLVELARGGGDGRLVVAHRPWPRPPGTAALGAALAGQRPPVVLDALDRAGVAARAALLLHDRAEPAASLVAAVHRRTAGVPALVDRLLTALAYPALTADRTPSSGDAGSADAQAWAPPGLLAQLGYALQGLAPGLRHLLLACALGAPVDAEVLVPLLGPTLNAIGTGSAATGSAAALDDLVEAARSEGLLTADGQAIPLVSAAVLAATPPGSRLETRRALAELELTRGGNVLGAARGLLGTGASGSRVAAVFAAAAAEATRSGNPAEEFYAAAVLAGAPTVELAARRAEAAMRTGDLDLALAQADQVLSASDQVPTADVVLAGTVAAAVLARRGMLARSAELYRWMGAELGSAAPLAVPALIGTGALDEAREILHRAQAPAAPGRPPTLLAGAEELMAQGVYDSVAGSPTAAMSKLVRSATLLEPPDRAALLPDTPAALAALVAIHCGELDVARSVLERATRTGLGGPGAVARHRLLLGWIALYRGAHATARAALMATPLGTRLEPRDELVAAALEVALARRASDPTALTVGWTRARAAIVHHPVDLFVLQPLGELLVAAARLREQSWVQPHLDEATVLLGRLGDPLLWAAPLHWAGVHAAMFDDTPDAAERHVLALEAGASTSRYAAAMAVGARQWLQVLARTFVPEAVEAAARRLHSVGLSWDAGKLAGQAAIRTRDKKAMGALLATARAMQSTGQPVPSQSGVPVDGQAEPVEVVEEGHDGTLSDREREVAALVLEGLTYKQIGEELFISAKTVEHHVARMRQRLGSGTRGELFASLRTIVGTGSAVFS